MTNAQEGRALVRTLREKQDALKVSTKELVAMALTKFEEVGCLKKSIKEAHSTR